MGEEKDLPPGRKLVECFTPFLLHLATSGLAVAVGSGPPVGVGSGPAVGVGSGPADVRRSARSELLEGLALALDP